MADLDAWPDELTAFKEKYDPIGQFTHTLQFDTIWCEKRHRLFEFLCIFIVFFWFWNGKSSFHFGRKQIEIKRNFSFDRRKLTVFVANKRETLKEQQENSGELGRIQSKKTKKK